MSTNYSPTIVTDGAVFVGDALMPSTATSATKLYDRVGGNNGTMYNGTCLAFDGIDDRVDVPDSSDLDGFSKFTLSGWVNPNVTGGYRTIFDKYWPSGFTWRISNIDYPYIYVNGNYLIASTTVTEGAWNHLVVTYDGTSTSNNVNFYMAGELVDTGTLNVGTVGTSSYGLKIGVDYGGSTSPMDGKLADLRIYDVILSAANVKELYDDSKVIIPSNVSQTNLMGWWPLVDGAGTIAYDGSGNGNDGTLTNMDPATDWLTGQTGCPQLVEGYNRPMRFDNPQYIEVPQDSTLDVGTSDFTFAAWTFLETGSQPNIAIQFAGAGGWRMVGAAGKVRFSVFDNGWTNYASMDISPALTLDQWNHVAVSVDRDGSAQSYINGVAKTSLVVSGVTSTLTNAYPLRFGAGSYTNGAPTGDYIAGTINEAIMYIGTALNAADIAALAATGTNGGPLPPDPTTMTYSTTSYSSSYLKGYWRNDGIVTWADRSGNGNTGTANGSPNALLFKQGYNGRLSTSTGRDGQGFPLLYENNGAIGFVSDSVDFGNVVSFDNTDNFTVEAWFKAALDGSGNGFSYQPIISKEGSAEFGYGIKLDYNVAGGPWLYGIATGTTSRYQYSSALNAGQWYHACVTFNSSANYITVFIDGAQNHGPYLVQGAFNGTTNTNSLKLGNGSHYTADFRGQIGSSKIYNRLLSQAEIKQNYNAQKRRFE